MSGPRAAAPSALADTGNRTCLTGIVVAAIAGLALRLAHLGIPMRYDEAHMVLKFLGGGPLYPTTTYEEPNNHVLHTVLAELSTMSFGMTDTTVRAPALVAGALLPLAVAWLAWRLHGRETALLAAVLVAAAPILIEYSTNARGYSMVGLFAVLGAVYADRAIETRNGLEWAALGAMGVLGAFTIPIMLFPWAGLCVWVLLRGLDRPRKTLGTLALLNLGVGVCAALLYAPILSGELETLTANAYVTPQPWAIFLESTPGWIADIGRHWFRGVPLVLGAIIVAGVAVGLAGSRSPREWLVPALLFGSALVLLRQRNFGFERVWLWALPFVLVLAAHGVVLAVRRAIDARRLSWAVAVLATLWMGGLGASTLANRTVWASRETGMFPESREVADVLVRNAIPDDALLVDPVALEPVRYYMHQYETRYPLPQRTSHSSWIVFNMADTVNTAHLMETLGQLEITRENSELVEWIGNALVYVHPPLGLGSAR